MTSSTVALELDNAQLRVAEAEGDSRQIVIAGAGQGKTEVVAARLAYLISDEGFSASLEVLVLSFSRAAVHAVRTRLSDRDGAEVNVRTFDSFAGQILLEAGVEPTGDFASRIRRATRVLREADETPDLIADLRHIVIDEVQDLVGDRAEFVLAILEILDDDAGFTVLGDPLQGIYDFVLDDSESRMTFDGFFEKLREYDADQVSLERNYRARGEDCLRVAELAVELRKLDGEAALKEISDFEDSLPRLLGVADWSFLDLYAGRSAILCRTNAEVLRISRILAEHEIDHAVRRPAQSFGAAPWLAESLDRLSGPEVPRSAVEQALAEKLVGELNAADAWHLVKSAEGSRNSSQLNLSRLRSRVRSTTVPLSLTQGDTSDLVVSTIHRAKGLEFDNVFIVESDSTPDKEDVWAQVRNRYVALSRARDDIVIVAPKFTYSVIKKHGWLPGRLQERVRSKGGKTRPRAFEFLDKDLYTGRPTGAGTASSSEVQAALAAAKLGRPVRGELDIERSDLAYPVYSLTLDGEPIGRTTEEFGEDFAKAYKVRPGVWPAELDDLLLVSVESTAGDPQFTEEAGLGPGGFWLVPRVVGLARPVWDVMEELV